jgi:hypothetical protein
MYSWDLYYNHFMLETLGYELHANINSNALKIILVLFVY